MLIHIADSIFHRRQKNLSIVRDTHKERLNYVCDFWISDIFWKIIQVWTSIWNLKIYMQSDMIEKFRHNQIESFFLRWPSDFFNSTFNFFPCFDWYLLQFCQYYFITFLSTGSILNFLEPFRPFLNHHIDKGVLF